MRIIKWIVFWMRGAICLDLIKDRICKYFYDHDSIVIVAQFV